MGVEGGDGLTLVVATDRTSNGPVLLYPQPGGMGGAPRVEKAHMPKAPVPAAQAALQDAGVDIKDIDAVTTHNPFAVNDLWFTRQTGYPLERMNAYGCSLVYGHPQGPTGLRLIAELIETLRERGGGTGLFTGCAAGDTGAAVVIRVQD